MAAITIHDLTVDRTLAHEAMHALKGGGSLGPQTSRSAMTGASRESLEHKNVDAIAPNSLFDSSKHNIIGILIGL
ncbi:MAG: hypothetical protein JJU06_13370 [Ectothiorhodospiraceae bacterium]|nr:hypothetical protein [Ectothiorhodospiraceae bacterium]MCH8504084.1 hypothetical protein [Ectothiorhodospiraceae bacterium]